MFLSLVVAFSTINENKRVFVGGLECTDQEKLRLALEAQCGRIESIFILRETSAHPYAFVDFVHAADAQRALGANDGELWQEIKPAVAIAPHKRQHSAQRKQRAQQDHDAKLHIAQESTTLIQIQRSHLHRVQAFLEENEYSATGSYCSSSLALLGVQAEATELHCFFENLEPTIPIFQCAVRKLYSVDPNKMVKGNEQGVEQCVKLLKAEARVRLNVFPPAVVPEIIGHLEENHPELLSILSPKEFTHKLNVVKIPTKTNHFWCIGMEENNDATNQSPQVHGNNDMICRAQSKLQEAFARYKHALPATTSCDDPFIAVDCGAAPGGWTKFIADNPYFECHKVYSIDPGDLDPNIVDNKVVVHLPMKVEDAMSEIEKAERVASLWVSDMCLHQMSRQVDLVLEAQRRRIVGRGTFFVLTLKCNKGHSREAFDLQVAQQCNRIKGVCRNMQTIHLFSNRSGERTILGYLK